MGQIRILRMTNIGSPLLALCVLATGNCSVDAQELKTKEERVFKVYFITEDATITPEAAAVIGEAKLYYDRAPGASVEIWGHADRQGSRYYNFRLSKRRALATANALIALGADYRQIKTVWSGETQLPHQTDDGVSLSLNRVAVIRIQFSD
jgi:OOP family OmpA-OmpF porin